MMDCKKALAATDGDMEKAIDFLREKGLAAAAKKADRIAELLASATPEYEESVLKEMFRMHVDLTGQEISERLAGNYEKDLQTFWNIQRQIIAMADYFANGLETEAKESGLR